MATILDSKQGKEICDKRGTNALFQTLIGKKGGCGLNTDFDFYGPKLFDGIVLLTFVEMGRGKLVSYSHTGWH